ncbi:hypothetical protein NC651_018981 [Populus alba x Populus x berolinensis]|nr:hypothetical protein NC651_018981 [Populus alba x Populus x berolinensis]
MVEFPAALSKPARLLAGVLAENLGHPRGVFESNYEVGGLQLMKDSKWVAVKPNPDALIVNIGDLSQLPNLKLHLWSVQVLSKIAGVMGTPLFTDKITASRERVDYARICVEIPFDRALENPNSVTIEDEKACSYIQESRLLLSNLKFMKSEFGSMIAAAAAAGI